MPLHTLTSAILLLATAAAAQPPVPDLRIEAVAGGSVLYVTNRANQPLTAFLVELVNYPGSSFSLLQDNLPEVVAPGAEKRIPVSNMMAGAAPEYVKIQAAIFADGSAAGVPEKVRGIVERRRAILETTRELIRRVERVQATGTDKRMLTADLRQWSDSLRPGVEAARRTVIEGAIKSLDTRSIQELLEVLRKSEVSWAATKPPL